MFDIKNEAYFASDLQYDVEDADREVEIKITINTGRARSVARTKVARQDAVHVHADKLFRSIDRGARSVEKLEAEYEYDDMKVKFVGHEPLGADDLSVLLGLNALAQAQRDNTLVANPESEREREVRRRLELEHSAECDETLTVDASFSELAREIGYSGSRNTRLIRQSIERLCSVTIFYEKAGKRETSKLIADYSSNEKSGGLYVALNPRIARAICGNNGSQYIKYNMNEVRALKNHTAKLIHYRLCGVVNVNCTLDLTLERLQSYAWPIQSSVKNTNKARRRATKLALEYIHEKANWKIEQMSSGKYMITRPKLK